MLAPNYADRTSVLVTRRRFFVDGGAALQHGSVFGRGGGMELGGNNL